MNVLEIGCGLVKRPDTTVAIDKSSHAACDIVRDVAKRGIPFNDSWFDKVNSFDIIEHIERYEDLIFFINEVWRVLKPDGVWEFTTPLGISGLTNHMTHMRCFTVEGFKYLADDLPDDYEHMRISDGIVARFKTEYKNADGILNGIFKVIK